MDKQKTKQPLEPVYSRQALLQSTVLRGYQPDFAAALLKNDWYTLSEAKRILNTFAKGAV